MTHEQPSNAELYFAREEPLLCQEDEMGAFMHSIGIESTEAARISLPGRNALPFSAINGLFPNAKEYSTFLAATGFDSTDLIVYPLKGGLLEKIVIVTDGVKQIAVTVPNPDWEDNGYSLTERAQAFSESQEALKLSGARLPGFAPRQYFFREGGAPYAALEAATQGLDELNLGMAPANGWYTPTLQFFSQQPAFKRVNERCQGISAEENQILSAYTVAKVCAARSFMVLSTLQNDRQRIGGLSPNNPKMSAGDFIGGITGTNKLNLRPVCYRGGTTVIHSAKEIVKQLLNNTDLIYADTELKQVRSVFLVPQFKQREQWVRGIVRWSMKQMHHYYAATAQTEALYMLERFIEEQSYDACDEVEEAESPFQPARLIAIAPRFGSAWLNPSRSQLP